MGVYLFGRAAERKFLFTATEEDGCRGVCVCVHLLQHHICTYIACACVFVHACHLYTIRQERPTLVSKDSVFYACLRISRGA